MSRSSKRDIRKECKKVMFDLMRETSVEQITVTQICQAAGISRVTFYIYYDDKYMLLDDFFDDLWDSVIASYKEKLGDESAPLDIFLSFYMSIIHMYYSNQEVFSHTVAEADRNLNVRYYRNIRDYTESLLKDFSDQLRPYFSLKETSSILCTCMLGFFNALKRDQLSEEAMAERFSDLIRMMLRSELFVHGGSFPEKM